MAGLSNSFQFYQNSFINAQFPAITFNGLETNGQQVQLVEVNGNFYQLINAAYNGSQFVQINATKTSYALIWNGTTNYIYSSPAGTSPITWGVIAQAPLPISLGGTGTATPALVAGTAIAITGSWPNNTITNTGVTSIVAGLGISVSPVGGTGAVTITNTGTAVPQATGIVTYVTTNAESTGSPGVLGTANLTLPSTSPGANNNWRVVVTLTAQSSTVAWGLLDNVGIGTATAGTSVLTLFSAGAASHTISGGNCVSDVKAGNATAAAVVTVTYSAIYTNSATPSFTGLLGTAKTSSNTINGMIVAVAYPN